uniref:Uncharacterized protein n=1 Tax=Oryza glumipatula TaxID=40148 RepID=A0A0E0BA86_9ORYZ
MVEAQSGSRPEARPKRTLWQVMLVRPMATSATGHHRASATVTVTASSTAWPHLCRLSSTAAVQSQPHRPAGQLCHQVSATPSLDLSLGMERGEACGGGVATGRSSLSSELTDFGSGRRRCRLTLRREEEDRKEEHRWKKVTAVA